MTIAIALVAGAELLSVFSMIFTPLFFIFVVVTVLQPHRLLVVLRDMQCLFFREHGIYTEYS